MKCLFKKPEKVELDLSGEELWAVLDMDGGGALSKREISSFINNEDLFEQQLGHIRGAGIIQHHLETLFAMLEKREGEDVEVSRLEFLHFFHHQIMNLGGDHIALWVDLEALASSSIYRLGMAQEGAFMMRVGHPAARAPFKNLTQIFAAAKEELSNLKECDPLFRCAMHAFI